MDYALAKQLADMGFPQGGKGGWLFDPSCIVVRSTDRVYNPTLEELIEGCGSNFHMLENFCQRSTGYTWIAKGAGFTGSGAAPTEAVAMLFLLMRRAGAMEKLSRM